MHRWLFDIIAKKKKNANDYDDFFSINPEDILFIMHKGNIRLFDDELKNQIKESSLSLNNFSKINVNGSVKHVEGNIHDLINEIRKHYPEADLPISAI